MERGYMGYWGWIQIMEMCASFHGLVALKVALIGLKFMLVPWDSQVFNLWKCITIHFPFIFHACLMRWPCSYSICIYTRVCVHTHIFMRQQLVNIHWNPLLAFLWITMRQSFQLVWCTWLGIIHITNEGVAMTSEMMWWTQTTTVAACDM